LENHEDYQSFPCIEAKLFMAMALGTIRTYKQVLASEKGVSQVDFPKYLSFHTVKWVGWRECMFIAF
jgi:hypothetical protein